MNSLPKTVTGQRRDCDLNPGPTALESSTLTTRLPSEGEEGKGSNEKGRGRKVEGDKGKVKRRENEEEREREGREVSVSVRLSMSSVRLSVCPIHCYAVSLCVPVLGHRLVARVASVYFSF